MAKGTRRGNGPAQILSYWAIVVVVSLLLGGGAFAVGKYYIGSMVKGSNVDAGAPKVIAQTTDGHTVGESEGPAPEKAEVRVTQRAATDAERTDLEVSQPQDGAEQNQETNTASAPDTSVGDDKQPVTDTGSQADEAQTAAKPDHTGSGGAYSVVAGSFADPANADKEVSRLMGQGYTPYVVKVKRDGKTFHRVCVGSFADAKAAQRLRDKLREAGTEASIARE